MNNLPCKDCLTLGICKGIAIEHYNKKLISHSFERLTDNVMLKLTVKCALLFKYLEILEAGRSHIKISERIILGQHESGYDKLILKGKKDKLDIAKHFFNLPVGEYNDTM